MRASPNQGRNDNQIFAERRNAQCSCSAEISRSLHEFDTLGSGRLFVPIGSDQLKRRNLIAGLCATLVVSPLAAQVQRNSVPVIGFLASRSPEESTSFVAAFRQGLGEIGYFEGQNLTVEYHWAEGNYDRLPAMAADLVRRKVDVIATAGGPPTVLAVKNATSTIPIVFVIGTDPVGLGLVASLARPGGNLTGVSILFVELTSKRFELLSELVPEAKLMALLVNPKNQNAAQIVSDVKQAARAKGVQVETLKATTETEIDAAFASIAQLHAGGLIVGSDVFFDSQREQLVALAKQYAVPAIYPWRETGAVGGLLSYGASLTAAFRQVGIYAGKILKGAKPADLPVEQPSKLELVINMKTAKALGLTVPPSLLARADEMIE